MLFIMPGQEANRDIFSILFDMKVCCVFSLGSPHRSGSTEHTQYTVFIIKRKYPKVSKICSSVIFF